MVSTLRFSVTGADGGVEQVSQAVTNLVIAGMTGRDKAKVQEHLDELAELGIAGPSTIPIYYPLSPTLVTQADAITDVGSDSSGEVEAMLIGTPRGMLVTVASDHTDRKAEAYSIHLSKQLCAKPIAGEAWWYADVAARWDSLTLRADQDGELYQEGDCTAMLPPAEIIRGACGADELPPGWVMPLGTLPVHGGIRSGREFKMTLADPQTGRTIEHAYCATVIPTSE